LKKKQLEFSGIVQDLNVILDDSMNSLVEGVTSSSVSEIEKKIQSHNDVLNKYNEQESKKSNLEKLHKEVTELGDNSGKFSSLSFNDISEKHNKVGVELNKRTEELEKEKELQLSHVKMISEWNEKAKEFSTHTTQQKELLEKEESGTLLSQLRSLKEKHSLIQENQKNLEELKKSNLII